MTANLATSDPVTIAGSAVTLTLANAVSAADAVVVSYTVPSGAGTNPIRDASANHNNAAGLSSQPVTNVTPGILLSTAALSMAEGGSATYTVRLNTQPSGEVIVTITSDNAEVTVDDTSADAGVQNTLAFTTANWSTARTVTARAGTDTDTDDDTATLTHTASGGGYAGRTAGVAVTVTDAGDTTAPSLDGDTPPSVNGNTLTLTYDEALDTASVPPSGAFAVTVNGSGVNLASGSPVAIAGSAVTLTLASAVTAADTVAVSYTAPAGMDATPVRDASANHNAAADLSGQPVTNVTPGILLSTATLSVAEGGSATYTVRLNTQPSGTVTVTVARSPGGSDEVTFDTSGSAGIQTTPLTFTTTNWGTARTVTVNAATDTDLTNDEATLTHSAGGGGYDAYSASLPVTVTDAGDTTAPALDGDTPPSVNGNTLTLTYDEALDTASVPSSGAFAVTVNGNGVSLAAGSPVAIADSAVTLTLASAVSATDTVAVSYTAPSGAGTNPIRDASANHNAAANLSGQPVTNVTPGVLLSTAALTVPEGGSATYTVRLNTEPSGEVTVTITSDNAEVTVDDTSPRTGVQNTLTFTNRTWNGAQTVTLRAATDADGDTDTATLTHRAAGGGYDGYTAELAVSVSDEADTTAPALSTTPPPSVNGATLTLTYDEPLDAGSVPDANAFTVAVDGSEVGLATGNAVAIEGSAVTLTLASAVLPGAAVTVSYRAPTGAGTMPVRDVAENNAADLSGLAVTNATPGLLLSETSLTLDEDGSDTYTVALATAPSGEVTVSIASDNDDVTIDDTDSVSDGVQNALTFTTTNWNAPQTVTVRAAADTDDDADIATLTHTAEGGGYASYAASLKVTVSDEGDVTAPVLSTETPPSVSGATLTLTYNEPLDTDSVPARSAFTVEADGSAVALATGDAVAVDGSAVTLTLASPVASGAAVTLDYRVPTGAGAMPIRDLAENNAADLSDQTVVNTGLGLLLSETSLTLDEGGSDTYTVALRVAPSGDVTVAISSDNDDVTIDDTDSVENGVQNTLTFTTANWSAAQTVTVRAAEDDDDNGADDSATLTHAIGGAAEYGELSDPTLPVTVTDNDKPDTTPPALAEANPLTVDGARLVLTYDEALDEDSVPDRDAFAVKVNGGEARLATSDPVTIAGRAVTLRLRRAVEPDDTVTVSYTAPASDPIRDRAGHAAANLRNRAVTNVTDDTTAPLLRSATITYEMLVMRYDEALDESSVPAASAFEVWVAGARASVEDVEVDGRTVRLTLASAAAHGDTGSVKYVAPSANPIRDLAGNKAKSTAGHRVWTNNTPEPRDTTAPTLSSATVTNATLVLAYNEALDEDSVPAASAYTVRVAGSTVTVAAVAVDSSKVKLTLASEARHGDAVTVSYAAPSADPIRDPAGNEAANLSSRAATNDTPAPSDTTAPALSSATMTDNRIVLAFDEALDENSVPQASAFRALVDGGVLKKIDHVAVAGSAVTLEVRPSAVSCGGDWTVSYSVPGAYPLQDTSGNAAGGFSNRAVTMAPNTPGITVTAPSPSPMREGGTATFTVKLDAMPCWMVNIELSSDNPDVVAPHHRLLSFAAVTGSGRWDRPQTVTVHSRQDQDAADETGTFTLAVRGDSPGGYTALPDVTVIVEVADDDEAALSVADASVGEEAGATLDFRVTIDRARHLPVTVDYATRDGTARAGQDYTATRGTLTFAAGEKSKTVAVPVLDDAVDEGDETLLLRLSNASEAGIGDGEATGTITNSDPMPQAWLARFGRAAADQAMQAVSDRLTGAASGQATAAGLRLGGLERYRPLSAAEAEQAAARYEAGEMGAPAGGMGAHGGGSFGSGSGFGAGAMPNGPGGGFSSAPGAGFGAPGAALGASPGLAPGMGASGLGAPGMGASGFGGAGMGAPGGYPATGGYGPAGTGHGAGMFLDLRMLLAGTSFLWATEEAEGPRLTTWGRGAATRFDGADDGLTLSGEVVGGTVGADIEHGRWLAGLAVSHATGTGEYSDAESGQGGEVRSALTSLHPYLKASLGEGLDAWGMLGYGRGDMTLGLGEGRDAIDTGLESRMGALGLIGELWSNEWLRLGAKSDVMWSSTRSAATASLAASTGDAGRARIAMQGAGKFALGAHEFMPAVEVGVRYDAGDAETGYGVELGLGLGYAHPELGVRFETRGRVLLAHEDDAYREWGASASLSYQPRTDGRGVRFGLESSVGTAWSGVERMWSMQNASELAPGMGTMPAESRVSAKLGYGFDAPVWRGLATPFLELDASGASGRQRAGVLFERGAKGSKLEFTVERAPAVGGALATPSPGHANGEGASFGLDGPAPAGHEFRYQLQLSVPLGRAGRRRRR